VLKKLYTELSKGNFSAAGFELPDNVTFNVAGKSLLAGKYTKETFTTSYLSKLKELSGNALKLEVHDVLESDRHATVLLTYSVNRNGQSTQIRSVHVWRMENGIPVAGYEYPRDMYQYDLIWS
jgi:hypothetical protein